MENSEFIGWLFSQERTGYRPYKKPAAWRVVLAHVALWLAVIFLFKTGFPVAGYVFFALVCLLSLRVLTCQTEEVTGFWPAVILAVVSALIIAAYALAIVVIQKYYPQHL